MNTDLDPENELLQLVVEELVRAGLRTPLREPILAAVEDVPEDPVQLVEPEVSTAFAGDEGTAAATGNEDTDADADPGESTGKGPVTKAAQGLVVFVALFAVLYLTLRRLTGDDEV